MNRYPKPPILEDRRNGHHHIKTQEADQGRTYGQAKVGRARQTSHCRRDQNPFERRDDRHVETAFGRYPEGTDPVFFDPDADTPQAISKDAMATAMYDFLPENTTGNIDDMLGAMSIGPDLKYKDLCRNLELIDRVIADKNADDTDWSSAYWLLAEMTSKIVEQTELPNRRYVPKAPPVYNIDDGAIHDTSAAVAYVRDILPVMRRDFAEYWSQYLGQVS